MKNLVLALLICFAAQAFAGETIIKPGSTTNSAKAGNMYLQTSDNHLVPATVVYSTDGNGNLQPIQAVGVNTTTLSLGNSLNKSNVLKTGTVTTTATTSDQVVLTYTVTSGKTFYLQYLNLEGRLTTPSATAKDLGVISLETPSGTKVISNDLMNLTTEGPDRVSYHFAEPVPVPAAAVVRAVVTPGDTTSMIWRANFGGYEK